MADQPTTEILQAIAELGARMERRFEAAERALTEFKIEVGAHLDGIHKRLGDQNQIMAALISTEVAVVVSR